MHLRSIVLLNMIVFALIQVQLHRIYRPHVGHARFLMIGNTLLIVSSLLKLLSSKIYISQLAVMLLAIALFLFTLNYFILSAQPIEQIFLVLASLLFGSSLAAAGNSTNFIQHSLHTNLIVALMLQYSLLALRFYLFLLNQFSLTVHYNSPTKIKLITFAIFRILLCIFVGALLLVIFFKVTISLDLVLFFVAGNVACTVFYIFTEPIYTTAITQNFYSLAVFRDGVLLHEYNFTKEWNDFVSSEEYIAILTILQNFILDIVGGEDFELQFIETESIVMYYAHNAPYTALLIAQHASKITNNLFHSFINALTVESPTVTPDFHALISNIFKLPVH